MNARDIDRPLAECPKSELWRLSDTISALASEFERDGGYNVTLGMVWEEICDEIHRRAL